MRGLLDIAASTRWMRRIALPIFERINPGNVHIRHHYTRRRFVLHSYRHKGYWFHGLRREQATMQFFQQVLSPGDSVIEVGGHIGYLTLWFAELVGTAGRVLVFEPGNNNLPYLRENTAGVTNVELFEMAISDTDGVASFFEEGLTGQNNSLLADYRRFTNNRQLAFSGEEYCERSVATARLDTLLRTHALAADLVKIDIEGAEYLALAGATELLTTQRPMLMVEVTERAGEVIALLSSFGYELFTPSGINLATDGGCEGNVCALHPQKHAAQRDRWLAELATATR